MSTTIPTLTSPEHYQALQARIAALHTCLCAIERTASRAQTLYTLGGLTKKEYSDHMEGITAELGFVQGQYWKAEDLLHFATEMERMSGEMMHIALKKANAVLSSVILAKVQEGDTPV